MKNNAVITDIKIKAKRIRQWFDYEATPRPNYMVRPKRCIPVRKLGLSTGRVVIVNKVNKHD